MKHVVKINGFPIGEAEETRFKKVEEGVEYTLCSFNSNDFSMWVPSYVFNV